MNENPKPSQSVFDPYDGNILIQGLGEIPSPMSGLGSLIYMPPAPPDLRNVPAHVRAHLLMNVRDFHYPPLVERQLLDSVNLMVRQSYKYRNPTSASTWASISGELQHRKIHVPPAMGAAVEGISGVGKTQACLRCLSCFPQQVIVHPTFPKIEGELLQVVWLSAEVPPSGKAVDLARTLMESWRLVTGSRRFDAWLAKDQIRDGMRALDEWRQVAVGHFLGILHLDEVQNLFRLATLRQRKDRKGAASIPELSIVEDQVLRWILFLINSGQIALLVSGTPDGIGALTKRLSTLQRLNTGGYHAFEPIASSLGENPESSFLGHLARYQYVRHPIVMNETLARLIVDLTGGVQRIVIALWIAAHRVALGRKADDLIAADFTNAASTWLAPLAPAVAALRAKDFDKMARYEDLIRRDTSFWASFWSNVSA